MAVGDFMGVRTEARARLCGNAGGRGEDLQGVMALPGGAGGQKNKTCSFLSKPFSILHICGEPFNGDAENAGEYNQFIISDKAQAGFNAADSFTAYAKTGHLEFGGKCVL